MAEQTTYVGYTANTPSRDTYLEIVNQPMISATMTLSVLSKSPFTKAIGVEAFGEAMANPETFGTAMQNPTGRILRYDSGHSYLEGQIGTAVSTGYHVGRLGTVNPELVEGGDTWKVSWHQLMHSEFIPENDVDDNGNPTVDMTLQKLDAMRKAFVNDWNKAILGHSSGPSYGTMGPYAVETDLTNLVSVTQTTGTDICGIDRAASSTVQGSTVYYWKNQYKAITSVGGGGNLDRPILLRRGLKKLKMDQMDLGEASDDFLIVTTPGGVRYYDRLMYAEAVEAGAPQTFGLPKKYDAAGINAMAFDRSPMVYDSAVTVPVGATASTEAFYILHIPSFFISIRKEMNFKFEGWEKPRAHDSQRTLVGHIMLRYTPGVSARRVHGVAYNIPANPD